MRKAVLLLTVLVGACSSAPSHELAQTSDKDLVWQLNEGKWSFNDNTLVTPPLDPAVKRETSAKAVVP